MAHSFAHHAVQNSHGKDAIEDRARSAHKRGNDFVNFRIWSETATPEQIRDPRTLALLRDQWFVAVIAVEAIIDADLGSTEI